MTKKISIIATPLLLALTLLLVGCFDSDNRMADLGVTDENAKRQCMRTIFTYYEQAMCIQAYFNNQALEGIRLELVRLNENLEGLQGK